MCTGETAYLAPLTPAEIIFMCNDVFKLYNELTGYNNNMTYTTEYLILLAE